MRYKNILYLCCFFNILYAEVGSLDSASRMLDDMDKANKQFYINEELEKASKKAKNDDIKEQNQDSLLKIYHVQKIIFDNYERLKLFEKYENKTLSKQDILSLIAESTNYFIQKGYVTTLVSFKDYNKDTQELVLHVFFGYVDKILLNGAKLKSLVIPSMDVLDIYKLDQGLENLNNSTHSYTMEITPSKENSKSNVNITSHRYSGGVGLGLTNQNSKDYGSYVASARFSQNDLLDLYDRINFSYYTRLMNSKGSQKDYGYDISLLIPVGFWSFSYSNQYAFSKYFFARDLRYSNITKIRRHSIGIKWLFFRNQTSKLSLLFSTKIKDTKNRLADILLQESSGIYSNIGLKIELSSLLFGGSIYSSLEYELINRIFSSKKNNPMSNIDIEASKINFDVSYQKYLFAFGPLALRYSGNIGISYSPYNLLNADKVRIGDQYTIRGFKENYALYDSSGYFNNTFALKQINPLDFLNIEPFIGIDFGYGKNNIEKVLDYFSGVSIGLSYHVYDNFYFNFTCSRSINSPKNIEKEKLPIYLSMFLNF